MSEPTRDDGGPERGVVAVVDDDSLQRKVLRAWLSAAGYAVIEFADGQSAARAGAGEAPVVFLDLDLGDSGGGGEGPSSRSTARRSRPRSRSPSSSATSGAPSPARQGYAPGRFEQAQGGTLFLDELGEMSAATQAALLRTLEERTVRRVGGAADIPVDVRIVCATHRDLESEVEAGRFRQDLYFRLVVYPVEIPALRARRDDLPSLVGHLLRKHRADVGRDVTRLSPDALEAMARYDWPGNVRERQNVVHRAMLSCDGDTIALSTSRRALRRAACCRRYQSHRPPRRPPPRRPRSRSSRSMNSSAARSSGPSTRRRGASARRRSSWGSAGRPSTVASPSWASPSTKP